MNLKEQEGVETVSSLSPDVFQCAFKYKNDRINQTAVDWANKTIVSKSKVKLNRTSPYDGKETENIQKNKLSNTKKVAIAAGLTVLVAASIVGCNKYLNAKDNKQEVVVVEEEPKQVVKIKKEAPMSWEQYLEEYEDSFAKEFLQNSMSFVDSSIRTKKIGDEEVMYGITPKQADMVSLYYDSSYYSNEELLSILGDYPLTGNLDPKDDINNVVNSYTRTIIANLCLVESEDDFITFTSKDEEVNELNKKYESLWLKFMKAEKKKEKKAIREEFEEAFTADFIDAADGVIDLQEHPAAHLILNTYPASLTIMGYPMSEGINKILVGTEANVDVAEVGTIPESRGLVDDACDIIDRRLENFENWRYQLIVEDSIIDRENERGLLQDPNFLVLPSNYDELTFLTYEYDSHDEHDGVMVPIRDEYLKEKYPELKDVELEDIEETIRKAVIEKIQKEQLNNTEPFDPVKNPTGGKKGDVYVVTEKVRVEVPEHALTEAQKQEAIRNAKLPEGVMTEEQVQKDIAQTQKEVDNLQAIYDAIYSYYKNGGTEASLPDGSWKSHPLYNNAKTEGTKASQAGSYTTNEGASNTITDENGNKVTVGEHQSNQNQQNVQPPVQETTKEENAPAPTPVPETPKEPTETPDVPTVEDTNQNTTGGTTTGSGSVVIETPDENAHANNPNQNGQNTNSTSSTSTTSEITYDAGMEDIIPGTITTDSEGVWTPGDEEAQADANLTAVYAAIAEFAVEEMANQPSEEMEQAIQLTK